MLNLSEELKEYLAIAAAGVFFVSSYFIYNKFFKKNIVDIDDNKVLFNYVVDNIEDLLFLENYYSLSDKILSSKFFYVFLENLFRLNKFLIYSNIGLDYMELKSFQAL